MIGIVNRAIAIPVCWRVLDKAGNSNTKERIAILEHVLRLFGVDKIASLLADREFIGDAWLAWLQEKAIPFHIRIRSNIKIANTRGRMVKARELFRDLKPGESRILSNARRLSEARKPKARPVFVAALHLKTGELLIVVTNDAPEEALAIYAQRWQIETLFAALKTRGFNLEDTHMTDPERISKLTAVLSITFCWAHKVGDWLHEAEPIRTRLSELAGVEEITDEQNGPKFRRLRVEYGDVETRAQAAIVADDEPKPTETSTEDRQLATLVEGSSIGAIFGATLEHRQTDGQTAELQTELGLSANQIPLVLLRDPEHRATGVTPAPGDVAATQAEIIPAVFPMSCAAYLGVDMPTVPTGEAIFPVLSTSADVGVPIEGASQDETAGAFTADVLSPGRLQASFFYSREDRARFKGMDAALRMNLSDALSDKLDQQILNGGEGLLNGTNLANNNAAAETTFAGYLSSFGYARVDGKYAMDTEDLRIVMGSATYAHAGTTYRHQNADDLALDRLVVITSGVKVSAHVPAAAASKQNAIVRLGMRRDMVAPIWEGVTLIPDEVTKAANGQIVVTAVMLHAVKILRADGFYKQQAQHA